MLNYDGILIVFTNRVCIDIYCIFQRPFNGSAIVTFSFSFSSIFVSDCFYFLAESAPTNRKLNNKFLLIDSKLNIIYELLCFINNHVVSDEIEMMQFRELWNRIEEWRRKARNDWKGMDEVTCKKEGHEEKQWIIQSIFSPAFIFIRAFKTLEL